MDKKTLKKYIMIIYIKEEQAQFEIAQEVTSGAEQIVAVRKMMKVI